MAEPIFPPNEPNFSSLALEHSNGMLDQETQDVLRIERANMIQSTHMAVFTLGIELDLSDDTRNELSTKLAARLQNMSPAYHEFINKLISESAAAMNGQQGSSRVFIKSQQSAHADAAAINERSNNGYAHSLNGAAQHESQPLLEPEAVHADVTNEDDTELFIDLNRTVELSPVSTDEEATVSTNSAFEEVPDEKYILELPDDLLLYDNDKKNKNQLVTLQSIFPQMAAEISALNPRELTLLAWEVIEYFNQNKIPRITGDNKKENAKRLELYLGLYSKPLNSRETGERSLVSKASIMSSLQNLIKHLRKQMDSIAEEVLLSAIVTARQPDTDRHFTTAIIEREYLPPDPTRTSKGAGRLWHDRRDRRAHSGEGTAQEDIAVLTEEPITSETTGKLSANELQSQFGTR